SSVNASFMERLLWECESTGIPLVNYSSTATGIRKISEGTMMITEIILEPHILVLNGTDFNRILKAIEHAQKNSVTCNSVKTKINIQPQVIFKMLEEIV
ncbi:MAG: hypothetical protein ACJ75J_00890, partial [Cytophagaceae bacterium]